MEKLKNIHWFEFLGFLPTLYILYVLLEVLLYELNLLDFEDKALYGLGLKMGLISVIGFFTFVIWFLRWLLTKKQTSKRVSLFISVIGALPFLCFWIVPALLGSTK